MRGKFLTTVALAICLLASAFLVSAEYTMQYGADKNSYEPGTNITLDGTLYNGTAPAANMNITVVLNGTEYEVTTDANGEFSTEMVAPSTTTDYTMTFSAGGTNSTLDITVSSIAFLRSTIIQTTNESLENFSLSTTGTGFTTNNLTGTFRYGSFQNNGTTYYVLAVKSLGATTFDTLYVAKSRNFNASAKHSPLKEGVKAILGRGEYTFFYLNPVAGNKAIFVKEASRRYTGTSSRTRAVFALALNSTNEPIFNETLDLDFADETGEEDCITLSSAFGCSLLGNTTVRTNTFGYATKTISLSTDGGRHDVILEDGVEKVSYTLIPFGITTTTTDEEGTTLPVLPYDDEFILFSSALNFDTNTLITNATITATLVYPNGTQEVYTLASSSSGTYNVSVDVPALEGNYELIIEATSGDEVVKLSRSYRVLNTEVFAEAFSATEGKGAEGFSPGGTGYIVLGAKSRANGSIISLQSMTNNCAATHIVLPNLVKGSTSTAVTIVGPFNLTEFFDNQSITDEFVQEEATRMFGTGGCALAFTVPSNTGVYKATLSVNISGSGLGVSTADETTDIKTTTEYISVQDIFAGGYPADELGRFSDVVSPGSTQRFNIEVFDPVTQQFVEASKIISVDLVEVTAEGSVVTEKMINPAFAVTNGQPQLSFKVNDSAMGHHSVTYVVKANVTRGSSTEIVEALGRLFFREEVYSIFAYPSCGAQDNFQGGFRSCAFGSNNNITIKVEAFDALGRTRKGGLTVSVASITNFDTGKAVTASTTGCTTTDATQDNQTGITSGGTCTVTLTMPSAGWDSGGHNVELSIEDSDGNTATAYTFFEVRNLNVWGWVENGDVSGSQALRVHVDARNFFGEAVDGTVSVASLLYEGNEGRFIAPKPVSGINLATLITGSAAITNGSGTVSVNLTGKGLQAGNYQLVLRVSTTDGNELTRVWFRLRPFVVWMDDLQNWQHSYDKAGNMTFGARAYSTIDWSTWPPTGTPFNITSMYIQEVRKFGQWDKVYKKKSQLTQNSVCSGNKCNLSVVLSGFANGDYEFIVYVVGQDGSTATEHYWGRIESFSVSVPQLDRWRTIPETNRLVTTLQFSLNTKNSCGSSNDEVIEPIVANKNITNCYTDQVNVIRGYDEINNFDLWEQTFFLLNRAGANGKGRLYINAQPQRVALNIGAMTNYNDPNWECDLNVTLLGVNLNLSNYTATFDAIASCPWGNFPIESAQEHNGRQPWDTVAWNRFSILNINRTAVILGIQDSMRDFNREGTQNATINQTFQDTLGYVWNITGIDTATGKITVTSLSGGIKTFTEVFSNGTVVTHYEYIYRLNNSLSKSGFFLDGGEFWDSQWARIDLDDDGQYDCHQNQDNNRWECERYYTVLADTDTANVYTNFLISASRNITKGVQSKTGLTGDGDIRLNTNASPIYLLSVNREEIGGVGTYRLIMTTNQKGWSGERLGTFQLGTIVKIPILVSSPATGAGVEGIAVRIQTLRQLSSRMNFIGFGEEQKQEKTDVTLSPAVTTVTNDAGLAILNINTTGIAGGEYSVVVLINDSGTWTPIGNDWENPQIELRSFQINSMLGRKGTVDVQSWSVAANNLQMKESDEGLLGMFTMPFRCGFMRGDDEYCQSDIWDFRHIWINLSAAPATVIIDTSVSDFEQSDIFDGNSRDIQSSIDPIAINFQNGGVMTYIVLETKLTPETFNISVGETIARTTDSDGQCYFNVTADSTNTANNAAEFTIRQVCPWGTWTVEDEQSHSTSEGCFGWCSYQLMSVTDDSVQLQSLRRSVTVGSTLLLNDIQVPQQGGGMPGQGRVRLVNISNDIQLVVYNSEAYTTSGDAQGWGDQNDAVLVMNKTSGAVTGIASGSTPYRFGQAIPAANNLAVVKSQIWDRIVYVSNLTIANNTVYPLPWSCDQPIYYAGTFTEEAVGFKVQGWGNTLSNRTKYLLLFDDSCDGVSAVTRARLDDDHILDDQWSRDPSCTSPDPWTCSWVPWDYDRPELGEMDWQYNFSEEWINVGNSQGYERFVVSDVRALQSIGGLGISAAPTASISLFARTDYIEYNDPSNITSLWVKATNFDGTGITGNITLVAVEGMTFSCGQMSVVSFNITATGTLTNGTGYIVIDLTNATSNELTLKFKVQDASNPNKYEIVTKKLFYAKAQQSYHDENCGGKFAQKFGDDSFNSGGAGGGGSSTGGGNFEGEQEQFEMPNCIGLDKKKCEQLSDKLCSWGTSGTAVAGDEECRFKTCTEFPRTEGGYPSPNTGGNTNCPDFCAEDSVNDACEEIECSSYDSDETACFGFPQCQYNTDGDTCEERVECPKINTETECTAATGCGWEANPPVGTSNCKFSAPASSSGGGGGGGQQSCSALTTDTTCDAQTGCEWNTGTNACQEEQQQQSCSGFSSSTTCDAQTGCHWNAQANPAVCEQEQSCDQATTTTQCQQAIDGGMPCTWNGTACVFNGGQ